MLPPMHRGRLAQSQKSKMLCTVLDSGVSAGCKIQFVR